MSAYSEDKSGWSVDLKNCSEDQLLQLAKNLIGSQHKERQLEIRREIIKRLRAVGAENQEIVDTLIRGMWKGDRNAMVREWSPALEISEQEFKEFIKS